MLFHLHILQLILFIIFNSLLLRPNLGLLINLLLLLFVFLLILLGLLLASLMHFHVAPVIRYYCRVDLVSILLGLFGSGTWLVGRLLVHKDT